MAKKKVKKEEVSIEDNIINREDGVIAVSENTENIVTTISDNSDEVSLKIDNPEEFYSGQQLCIDPSFIKLKTISTNYGIKNISFIDLCYLEKACALLCKRYETIARIDPENNIKFKEYKKYYDNIFEELEIRVANVFK